MDFFATLPKLNTSDKPIEINDLNNLYVGFVQRKYKNVFDKTSKYLPISFLETRNINGEISGKYLKIREQSFKSNLFRLKWDVHLTGISKEMSFLLEDRTKVSTNPRMLYSKIDKNYIFKKDILSSTCKVYVEESNINCAEIKVEKFPTSLKISLDTDDLTVIELLGIYYIIQLVY